MTVPPKEVTGSLQRLFPFLPAQTASRIANVTANEIRLGHVPTVVPKVLIQSPIWFDPQFASRRQAFTTEYMPFSDTREIEVASQANYLPSHGESRVQSSGLLRYLDLDVVMALSFAWTHTGDRHVEMRQRDILQLMGYDDLTQAPYPELRASVRRLGSTKIAVFPKGLPKEEVNHWQILDYNERIVIQEQGQPVAVKATLSEGWEAALRGIADWQVVDLQCYAHLVRTYRRNGLARPLYLYLASWRTADRSFEIPLRWIEQRFADRNAPVGPEDGMGTFRYRNPLNPQSRLFRAFKTLYQAGVIDLEDAQGERGDIVMKGRFVKPTDLAELPLPGRRPVQTVLIHTSMFDERIADFVEGPAESPSPQEPPVVPPSPTERGPKVKPTLLANGASGTISPLARMLPQLREHMHVSKRVFDQGRERGWDDAGFARVLLAALWKEHLGEIRKTPEAWAAAIIQGDEGWTQEKFRDEFPLDQMAAWAKSPEGPLHQPTPPSTLRPETANGASGTISPSVTDHP